MTRRIPLHDAWEFRRLNDQAEVGWSRVELPHSPFVADLDGRNHWFGECEYRHSLEQLAPADRDRCFLFVGAAMHSARVFVDQDEIGRHSGGYLPFAIDLTDALKRPRKFLRLVVSNGDHPDVPPGKRFDELDFCWYGGLYRGAELRIRPPIYITDSVTAGEVAGGGVFIRTLEATPERATVRVRTHILNTSEPAVTVRMRTEIKLGGETVISSLSVPSKLGADASSHLEQEIVLPRPKRWSPASPHLYEATISVLSSDNQVLDSRVERFGVRRISFSRSSGFVINGERLRLRGTNRHQEMPRAGYAVPRAAQYRDARRIKEAGFDYVRLSHYPQSPDFLDACDELGIVVMNCIPGWQFIGGDVFRDACYQAARDLIRRDRNHPCVVLWELSLNETAMEDAFMARLHAIGHEEYPGDQMFTCGWLDRYDVFVHSRQHGEIHTWSNGDKALVVAEYGDWEFYARNAGFDQKTGAGVFDRWSTSRQFRGDGERGLRQQAANHIVALNDTLSSPAVLDGQWAMFDYARGYDPVRAAVGVMDVFRLPKFSYFFYRSQRSPHEPGHACSAGPMVFIASHWHPGSDLRVIVFSNCDEVELRLNGTVVRRQAAAQTSWTQHLPHPPFYFELPHFRPGKIEAIGYLDRKPAATHAVSTPETPARLEAAVDDLGIMPVNGESDVLIVHARFFDRHGTLCVNETGAVTFTVTGAEILGGDRVEAEAGIASAVLRLPSNSSGFSLQVRASQPHLTDDVVRWSRIQPSFREPVAETEPALLPVR